MNPPPNQALQSELAALAADPALSRFVEPDGALLVVGADGERLLWASPGAGRLREALADGDGRLLGMHPLSERARALAGGLAPFAGLRLERIRLGSSLLAPLVTCGFRQVGLSSGDWVLAIAVPGPIEAIAAPRDAAAPVAPDGGVPDPEPEAAAAAAPDTPAAEKRPRARGTVRFLWQADAEGRFSGVSEGLAAVVGDAGADLIGRRWDELGDLVDDPSGLVSQAFARCETWTGRVVEWRIGDTEAVVPVDLAGMPVIGQGGQLLGFRGFGLCRTGEIRDRRASGPQAGPADVRHSELLQPAEKPSETAARLSSAERNAFREIARALGARFADEDQPDDPRRAGIAPERPSVVAPLRPAPQGEADVARILDRLPVGILVHRGDEPLFLNRVLLDLVDYDDVGQLAAEGGVPRLFRGRMGSPARFESMAPLALTSRGNESIAVDVRLTTVQWDGLPASLMVVTRAAAAEQGQRLRALELDLRAREGRLRELSSILDTATDGVIVLDHAGRILSLNRSAEALFGYDQNEVAGERFVVLLAPESHGAALDYLEGLRADGVASLLNDGREVLGRVRQGGIIPLFMTVGRVSEGPERKFCAVLRDITAFKKTEGELLSSKRAAEEASAQKSEFLAKVSHEIRTPLNAIIGFAEVMLEERFGPIGNERYKDYLRDIHASGGHVISLVNDLLDLAKVEAGRLELAFTSVNLNELVANGVTLMQPQAARERIVMRSSLAQKLPAVVADERSVTQIILNVVANAIRYTEAGGQVIVSTAVTERGEVVIRVRDTGLGMTPEEVEAAMQPFRQLATSRRGGGTGLGLPLTKALVEANRGALKITSARDEGTLVEVLFPPTRVLAD
ncbi:MAG: PAS domain-containing sensor histidine kinase [Microvirga sp.]